MNLNNLLNKEFEFVKFINHTDCGMRTRNMGGACEAAYHFPEVDQDAEYMLKDENTLVLLVTNYHCDAYRQVNGFTIGNPHTREYLKRIVLIENGKKLEEYCYGQTKALDCMIGGNGRIYALRDKIADFLQKKLNIQPDLEKLKI